MHLFLLVPNNSGSTLLHDLIATNKEVATLPDEGQFYKFAGPDPIKLNVRHIFTKRVDEFKNSKNYDWEKIKHGWSHAWLSLGNDKKIFLEKSPTNIIRTEMLLEHFNDVKFIIMVRNPYAVVEGILRGNEKADIVDAGLHAIKVLEIQKENLKKYPNSLFFTYEELTDNPKDVANKIKSFLNIEYLDINKVFYSKGFSSKITNLNDSQIKKLNGKQLKILNSIFSKHTSVLEFFNYSFLKRDYSFSFKKHGDIDVESIKKIISDFSSDEWKRYAYRQNTFDVHKDTLTIPIIFSEKFESEDVIYRDRFFTLNDEILKLSNFFIQKIGFGYITRAILVKLPAGKEVPDHLDAGESLESCYRCHIPIFSNDGCSFSVGDETICMKSGEVWEINNTGKTHSVKNSGQTDRVHFIIDWITQEK